MRIRCSLAVALAGLALAGPTMAQVPPYSAWSNAQPKASKQPGLIARWFDRLERHSCGYGKTHHEFGCTGHRGELIFVFGSCWQFFEEPCFRQPPPRWMARQGVQLPTPSVQFPPPGHGP